MSIKESYKALHEDFEDEIPERFSEIEVQEEPEEDPTEGLLSFEKELFELADKCYASMIREKETDPVIIEKTVIPKLKR